MAKTPSSLARLLPLALIPALWPSTANAQVGGPPIPPPGAPFSEFNYLVKSQDPSQPEFMVMESATGTRTANIYSMDPAGDLTLTSSLEVSERYFIGFGGDRLLTRANYLPSELRVYERTAAGWSFGYELSGPPLHHDYPYGNTAITDGETLFVSDPANHEIDVFDVSIAGTPVLLHELSIPTGKVPSQMAFNGTTLALIAAVPTIHGTEDAEIVMYERQGAGFGLRSALPLPPEYDLNGQVSLAIAPGRLAVGFPLGTTVDSCGRVVVYNQLGTFYSPSAEILDEGACSVTATMTAQFGVGVEFRGADELLILGGSVRGSRQYRWSGGAWQAGPRHLSDTPGRDYAFSRDWVVGLSRTGLQVFDNVNSLTNSAVVCTAAAAGISDEWALRYTGSHSVAGDGLNFGVVFDSTVFGGGQDALTVMLIGTRRGQLPLGTTSNVCVGGSVQRVQMDSTADLGITAATLSFDPLANGISAGDTAFFQTWRRVPGVFGGGTTNALALTFIP